MKPHDEGKAVLGGMRERGATDEALARMSDFLATIGRVSVKDNPIAKVGYMPEQSKTISEIEQVFDFDAGDLTMFLCRGYIPLREFVKGIAEQYGEVYPSSVARHIHMRKVPSQGEIFLYYAARGSHGAFPVTAIDFQREGIDRQEPTKN